MVPLALFSLGAPQLVGYEFRKIFLLQACALSAIFAVSLGVLGKPRSQEPASPGMVAMRTALLLLCICFIGYLPMFGANILWGRPLPLLLLKLSSALHLVLEFVLGFSGAVVVLEQSHQRLLGRHDKLAADFAKLQFEQGRIADLLICGIEDFAIDPGLIRIEITETALMRNVQEHANTLRRLRKAGIKISIDDFGTGYSSLSYLKNLPVDCLKIDRSFIGQMIEDPRDTAVVEAVIGIARSMRISVVAEGVERAEQIDRLRSLGCNIAQGFFFHRPMLAAQCRPLLEQLSGSGADAERSLLRLLRWAT